MLVHGQEGTASLPSCNCKYGKKPVSSERVLGVGKVWHAEEGRIQKLRLGIAVTPEQRGTHSAVFITTES